MDNFFENRDIAKIFVETADSETVANLISDFKKEIDSLRKRLKSFSGQDGEEFQREDVDEQENEEGQEVTVDFSPPDGSNDYDKSSATLEISVSCEFSMPSSRLAKISKEDVYRETERERVVLRNKLWNVGQELAYPEIFGNKGSRWFHK